MAQPTVESLIQLLHYCESFAKQMLGQAGEFYPFAAFLNGDGKVEALAGHIGEHPDAKELYTFLNEAIARMSSDGKLRAYALAANVSIPAQFGPPFPDGIRVHVEAPGFSRYVYTPYRQFPYKTLRKFLGFLPTFEYADPITVDVEPSVLFARGSG